MNSQFQYTNEGFFQQYAELLPRIFAFPSKNMPGPLTLAFLGQQKILCVIT